MKNSIKTLSFFIIVVMVVSFLPAISLYATGNETVINFLPSSAEDIANFSLVPNGYSYADGKPEGHFDIKFEDGDTKISGYQWAARGKSLGEPIMLDTTKPIYIDYDLDINEGNAGLSFYIGSKIIPSETNKELINITYLLGGKEIQIDDSGRYELNIDALVALGTHATDPMPISEIYDSERGVLTVGAVYLCSAWNWGNPHTAKKFTISGTEYVEEDKAQKVVDMISSLPDDWKLSEVSKFTATKNAFDALSTEEQLRVSNVKKYNSIKIKVDTLIALTQKTLAGDKTISLLPESAADIEENWNLRLEDDWASVSNLEYLEDGKTFVKHSGWGAKGKKLSQPTVFNTEKPIYIDYELTIKGNNHGGEIGGGGGFMLYVEGVDSEKKPLLLSSAISLEKNELLAYHSPTYVWPRENEKEGTFKGTVQVDLEFLKTLNNFDNAYDVEAGTLTISKIYIAASWDAQTTVTKFNVVGEEYISTPQTEADKVIALINTLPENIILSNISKITPVEAAYNKLSEIAKANVSNYQNLEAAINTRKELLDALKHTPQGSLEIDFMPKSESEIEDEWEFVAGLGDINYNFNNGTINMTPNGDYPSMSKYYEETIVLDATKPIYLEFDFSVTGNSWDNGGGFQLFVGDGYLNVSRLGAAIFPGIGASDITSSFAADYDPNVEKPTTGVFKGCVIINDSLDHLFEYASIYDTVTNTLTIGHAGLAVTWGSTVEISKLKLYGEPISTDQEEANRVINLIAGLPSPIKLSDETQLEEAINAYNALTDAQKALVTNYDVLEKANSEFLKLVGTEESEGTTTKKTDSGNTNTGETRNYIGFLIVVAISGAIILLLKLRARKIKN